MSLAIFIILVVAAVAAYFYLHRSGNEDTANAESKLESSAALNPDNNSNVSASEISRDRNNTESRNIRGLRTAEPVVEPRGKWQVRTAEQLVKSPDVKTAEALREEDKDKPIIEFRTAETLGDEEKDKLVINQKLRESYKGQSDSLKTAEPLNEEEGRKSPGVRTNEILRDEEARRNILLNSGLKTAEPTNDSEKRRTGDAAQATKAAFDSDPNAAPIPNPEESPMAATQRSTESKEDAQPGGDVESNGSHKKKRKHRKRSKKSGSHGKHHKHHHRKSKKKHSRNAEEVPANE